MTATPAPFVNLGIVRLTGQPSARWVPGTATVPPPVAVDLGGAEVFVYSREQAAALKNLFAEAERMHAEGGQS